IGFACGSAYLGNWDRASAIAGSPGPRSQQLEAFLAVIWAAQTVNQDQARSIALKLCNPGGGIVHGPGNVSDWLLWRLVGEASKAGVEAQQLTTVIEAITDAALKQRCKEEILRLRLSKLNGPDSQSDLNQLAADNGGRAVEAFCRHNAR